MVADVSTAVLRFSESKDMFDIDKKWFGSIRCTGSLKTSVIQRKLYFSTFHGILYILSGVVFMVILAFLICRVLRQDQHGTSTVDVERDVLPLLMRSIPTSPSREAIEQIEPPPGSSLTDVTEIKIVEDIDTNGERESDQQRPSERKSGVATTSTSSHWEIEIISGETPGDPTRT